MMVRVSLMQFLTSQGSRLVVAVAEMTEEETLQAAEEVAVTVEEEVETVVTKVRAVVAEAAVEATERVVAESVDQEVSTEVQAEAVAVVVDARETRVLKMARVPLLILLRLVASERDTLVKLVRMLIQWIASLALAVEREIRQREELEKVTGVTIKQKPRLVKKKWKKKRRK